MADVQDGACGAPGTEEWVKLQLEKVALALGKDIGYAQIHECAMAHICVDPNAPGGRRRALSNLRGRSGVLTKLFGAPWTYGGLNLHIGVTPHGTNDEFWNAPGDISNAKPKFYRLVSHVTKGGYDWSDFRAACLAKIQLLSWPPW